MMSVCDIYKKNSKRRGRSKYLLSVDVNVVKDNNVVPAKIVFVRNRNKRSDYLCILSTDTAITEEEIIRIYGKRWSIEVFFKVCKSYLCLTKECRSISFDAMTAHTSVVFTRATPHKARLTTLYVINLYLFRHLAQKFFAIRQYA